MQIFFSQPAFLHTLQIDIDKVINENYELDLSVFIEDLEKLEDVEFNIKKLKRQRIPEEHRIDINKKIYENLKHYIINRIKKLFNKNKRKEGQFKVIPINYSTLINDIYQETYDNKFPPVYTEHEYLELIYHIAIPFIIEIEEKNCEILKKNIFTIFKETAVNKLVENKTKLIYEMVEKNYDGKENNDDYIKKVMKFIEEQKDEDNNELLKIDIKDYDIASYLDILLGKGKIKWLKQTKNKEKISLNSILYYYQNYSKTV